MTILELEHETLSRSLAEAIKIGQGMERDRIVELIALKRDSWERGSGLNYRAELTALIAQIQGGN